MRRLVEDQIYDVGFTKNMIDLYLTANEQNLVACNWKNPLSYGKTKENDMPHLSPPSCLVTGH